MIQIWQVPSECGPSNLVVLEFWYETSILVALLTILCKKLTALWEPRYSTTDDWIQESIKQIFNSGLFWAVRTADQLNVMSLVERSVDGKYFVVLAYTPISVLQKELRRSLP